MVMANVAVHSVAQVFFVCIVIYLQECIKSCGGVFFFVIAFSTYLDLSGFIANVVGLKQSWAIPFLTPRRFGLD